MTPKIIVALIASIFLLQACKKNKADDPLVIGKVFLPVKITVSNAIYSNSNGTIEFTYDANRQITNIKRVSHQGNQITNRSYTYDGEKRLTLVRVIYDNALSSPSHYQIDYTYQYTGTVPSKVTYTYTNNLGETETIESDITKPQPNRFYFWTTTFNFDADGDLLSGVGSLYGGWTNTVTYSTNKGVFANLQRQELHYFFLTGEQTVDVLFFAKKELKMLKIDLDAAAAGTYDMIIIERNEEGNISRYLIKNATKIYAQFDMEYKEIL